MQYVYLLRAGKYYKIGISHNVRSRVGTIQPYLPDKVEIICTKYADTEAYQIEQELHSIMAEWKAPGANEWFALTTAQALELCIRINDYPDIDISERVILSGLLQLAKSNQKRLDKKLDYVINTYQKIKSTNAQEQVKIVKVIEKKSSEPKSSKADNDRRLYVQALSILDEEGRASTSLLQRKLRIGYGRAARLMDELETSGLIGPADGAAPRSVMSDALNTEIQNVIKQNG